MTKKSLQILGGMLLAWASTGVVMAQSAAVAPGTYVLEGSGYSIEIEKTDAGIVVHEPNKDSPYQPAGADRPNTFLFFNPNTGYTYGIRGVDNQTIEAFKDVAGNVPTRLTRLGGPPPEPGPGIVKTPDGLGASSDADVTRKYQALSKSDPDNVQSWTACSAAALKRSLATGAEADAYGIQVAQMLRLIAVDAGTSPCTDAIPQALWDKAGGIDDLGKGKAASIAETTAPPPAVSDQEAEEKRRLNAEMTTQAAMQLERIKADKDAYAAALAETERAQGQYQQDRATYEAEIAKANAAKAQYEADMAAYRAAKGAKASPQ